MKLIHYIGTKYNISACMQFISRSTKSDGIAEVTCVKCLKAEYDANEFRMGLAMNRLAELATSQTPA